MIKITGLSYTYPLSSAPVLKNINLNIENGDFILITGSSGSGKSTLLYCLNGLIPHLFNGNLQGNISINKFDTRNLSISEISKIVGTVFQNPENQLFMPTVKEDIAFGCRNMGLSEEEVDRWTALALNAFNITSLENKSIDELSAGQKQKVAIAGLYAVQPDIFLFDEPCTNLDQSSKKDFLEILKQLKKDGKTVIIAEHDPEELEGLFDKKFVLKNGEIFNFKGNQNDINITSPHDELNFSNVVMKLDNVSFGYDSKLNVLSGITFDVIEGDSVAIVGGNGCGKTTLFKLMIGVTKPNKGDISILGLSSYSLDDIAGKVGMLFQNPDEQLFTETVEDEIMFGPRQLKLEFDIDKELKYFGIERYRKSHPHSLSKGERQRVTFISVLAMRPDIIILDEPTTGLDYDNWVKLMDMAESFRKKGKTIIFSTHSRKVVKRYARRIITLDKGRIISDEISK